MKSYRVNDDRNLYGVALALYGAPEYAVKIMLDNSALITSLDQEVNGLTIVYDETIKVTNTLQLAAKADQADGVKLYQAKEGQSIFDLCIMLTGSLEGLVAFMSENGVETVNNNIFAGKYFSYMDPNSFLTEQLKLKSLVINTSDPKIVSGFAFSGAFRRVQFN